MTEVIIPAFRDAPEEGKIVGHLLAGYSELEVEMLQCAFLVSNDIDAAVRTLYKDRGESRRIEAARKITEQAYINAGLESKYALTMDNMDWCRLLRNRYAHCQWYYTATEGLCFIDLEDLANQTETIVFVTDARFPINVSLLSKQETYFKYVQKSLWHLGEQYRISAGALKPSDAIWQWPTVLVRPAAHTKRPRR